MRIKNNSKIYTAAIISTFVLGIISFGLAVKQDYKHIDSDNGYQQPKNYILYR